MFANSSTVDRNIFRVKCLTCLSVCLAETTPRNAWRTIVWNPFVLLSVIAGTLPHRYQTVMVLPCRVQNSVPPMTLRMSNEKRTLYVESRNVCRKETIAWKVIGCTRTPETYEHLDPNNNFFNY